MAQQQYVLIKSKLSGMVLDVQKASDKPGAHVIAYTQHGKDNQLWYEDHSTGTIRSKQTGFCLDLDGTTLVVRPYEKQAENQGWVREGAFIKNRRNNKKAIDLLGESKSAGAKVGVYEFHGKPNQQWDFVPATGAAGGPAGGPPKGAAVSAPAVGGDARHDVHTGGVASGREFWIVSELAQKVVDIQAGSSAEGAKALVWEKNAHPMRNQLWRVDHEGNIRSVLNDFAFTNKASGELLTMAPFKADNKRCQWKVDGKKIVNGAGECLDIKGADKEDGAELISYKYKDAPNQHWMLQYK